MAARRVDPQATREQSRVRLRVVPDISPEQRRQHRIARAALEGLQAHIPMLYALRELYPPRPRTRGECENGRRPCPFVSCKYHLALEVSRGNGELHLKAEDPLTMTGDSCALDVAARGEHSQKEVADYLGGVSAEWIRQTERSAEAQMRVAGGSHLREVLADYEGEDDGSAGELELRSDEAPFRDQIRDRTAIELEERRDVEAFAERAYAHMRTGLPLIRAWQLANDPEQSTDVAQPSHETAPDSNARIESLPPGWPQEMPMSSKTTAPSTELRQRVLEAIRGQPRNVGAIATHLSHDAEEVRGALRRLRIRGEAHAEGSPATATWYPGPRVRNVVATPKTQAKEQANGHPTTHVTVVPYVAPLHAPPELVIELLRAPPERIASVERMLARMGFGGLS